MMRLLALLSVAACAMLYFMMTPLAVAQECDQGLLPLSQTTAVDCKADVVHQVINCWIRKGGPNPPPYNYNMTWKGKREHPDQATCEGEGTDCAKICEIRSQGTIESTDYGYKLMVTLDGTEFTRNDGVKSIGGILAPGTILQPNECVVRIEVCPEIPELESLQFDFKGIAVSETGTVTMVIPFTR